MKKTIPVKVYNEKEVNIKNKKIFYNGKIHYLIVMNKVKQIIIKK